MGTLSHFHTSTLSLPLIHYHFTTRPHSSFTVSTLSLAHLSSCVYTRERGMDGSKSRVLRALEAAKTKFVKHHEPGFQHMRNFTTNSNNFRENASGGSRSMTKTTTFFRQQAARGSCKSLLSDHGIKAVMFYMLALSPTLISRSDSKREFLDWWGINSTAMPTEFYDFVAKHKETLNGGSMHVPPGEQAYEKNESEPLTKLNEPDTDRKNANTSTPCELQHTTPNRTPSEPAITTQQPTMLYILTKWENIDNTLAEPVVDAMRTVSNSSARSDTTANVRSEFPRFSVGDGTVSLDCGPSILSLLPGTKEYTIDDIRRALGKNVLKAIEECDSRKEERHRGRIETTACVNVQPIFRVNIQVGYKTRLVHSLFNETA